ncbi:endolytic transglycosylase MltG [Isachenkonia alkalipeptolytica]|uniref:Endolytic transglycosylase MltG n=1 Tax=Isachenkonia alkalipeptolytica TaxID=2565777 RepID=A0AA43XM14_9CLOT|nr:endolytic transglycosylase MltG [Isachenkonia alkalipeptolytica]NBG89162.1 endolytic transglycosylase MltG [Isachenkonia alkalipeptolytica]
MEKIKDLIYDHTDLLLSLLVIMVIIFIIGTNFTFFDQNLSSFIGSSNNGSSPESEPVISESEDEGEQNTTGDDSEEEKSAGHEESANEEDSETVTIHIPRGATASDVGDVLHGKDLVESSLEFVETTENLNVSHRLRPGTFDVPTGSTIEEIIQILIQSSL